MQEFNSAITRIKAHYFSPHDKIPSREDLLKEAYQLALYNCEDYYSEFCKIRFLHLNKPKRFSLKERKSIQTETNLTKYKLNQKKKRRTKTRNSARKVKFNTY